MFFKKKRTEKDIIKNLKAALNKGVGVKGMLISKSILEGYMHNPAMSKEGKKSIGEFISYIDNLIINEMSK